MRSRELAVPLQAFLAITICFSLIWMIYAMAFFDPTPPTAMEIKSVATDGPEINQMKTAAALTVNALFAFKPTQIFLPTTTPSLTSTATTTLSVTPSLAPTASKTPTGTATLVVVFTATQREDTQPIVNTPTKIPTPTPKPPTVPPPTDIPTDPPTNPPPTDPPPTDVPPTDPPPDTPVTP